jgi:hypothetical protein
MKEIEETGIPSYVYRSFNAFILHCSPVLQTKTNSECSKKGF